MVPTIAGWTQNLSIQIPFPTFLPMQTPHQPRGEKARKVRQAMAISIDRDLIIKEILRGFGEPAALWYWMGHERRFLPEWKWEYDPAKARQLLSDAGLPNGFDLTLTLAVRGAPGEAGACEAIADMWRQIGINVSYQDPPFGTYFPSVVARGIQRRNLPRRGAFRGTGQRLLPELTLAQTLGAPAPTTP